MTAKTATPIFNEAALGAEIAHVWGMFGAHAEAFGMMLTERNKLRDDRARLIEALRNMVHYQGENGSKSTKAARALLLELEGK